MMRELARLCDRNDGIDNQPGQSVSVMEDQYDKAFQEVMLAGRELYEGAHHMMVLVCTFF